MAGKEGPEEPISAPNPNPFPSKSLPSLLKQTQHPSRGSTSHLSTVSLSLPSTTNKLDEQLAAGGASQPGSPVKQRLGSIGTRKGSGKVHSSSSSLVGGPASGSKPDEQHHRSSTPSSLLDSPPPHVESQDPEPEGEREAGDESGENSSDFENLLDRVVSGKEAPSTIAQRRQDRRNKALEVALGEAVSESGSIREREGDVEEGRAFVQVQETLKNMRSGSSGDSEDDEEEQEDEEPILVGREEGQPDPRDMLREQLRKNEVRDRERSRTRGSISAASGVDELELEPPLRYTPRRYFILSSAGKLIFTTDKDEDEATVNVGVMQAIISIFADEGDRLRYIDAGSTKVSFLLKSPLYLVCVSDWGEPESILRSHLEYLYLQILSIVTQSQLSSIFARRSNFDLRRLLEGTESIFTHLTKTLQTSLPILTGCLEVFRMDAGVREEVGKALNPGRKVEDLLYILVLSPSTPIPSLITLIRPKKHSIHPTDLHLLLTTLTSRTSFLSPDEESWFPICLPRFNSKGFLHVYVTGLSENWGGGAIVAITGERDGFESMRGLVGETVERLAAKSLGERLRKEMKAAKGAGKGYSLGELAIPGLRHFLYKSRAYVQVTSPAWEGEYEEDENKFRLITLYQRLHDALHIRPAQLDTSRPAAKLMFLRTEFEAVLGWTSSTFELYVALSPLLPKSAIVSAAKAVTKWAKANEGRLFLTSAPSF
ncbi:DUF254-domain-containing protein [Meredithblackwellia eburnea MCA 4105]